MWELWNFYFAFASEFQHSPICASLFFVGQDHHTPTPFGMKVLVSLWWNGMSIVYEPETFLALLLLEIPKIGMSKKFEMAVVKFD